MCFLQPKRVELNAFSLNAQKEHNNIKYIFSICSCSVAEKRATEEFYYAQQVEEAAASTGTSCYYTTLFTQYRWQRFYIPIAAILISIFTHTHI